MTKVKLLLTTCIAVLALSSLGVASASAMSWFVGGAQLPTGSKAALVSKAVLEQPAVLNVPGLALKVSCTGLSGEKAEIEGGTSKGKATALSFEGCSEVSPSTCKVSPSTIVTEPNIDWLTHLSGVTPPGVKWLIHREGTSNVLATVTFVGSCSFAGEKPVSGTVGLLASHGSSEEVSQLLEGIGSLENPSLEIGGNKAFIEGGKALLKLVSGSKWSFRE